jgi:hypothetical protein
VQRNDANFGIGTLAGPGLSAGAIVGRKTRATLLRRAPRLNIATRFRRPFRGHRDRFQLRWRRRLSESFCFRAAHRQACRLRCRRRQSGRAPERAVRQTQRQRVSHDGPGRRLVCRDTGIGKMGGLEKRVETTPQASCHRTIETQMNAERRCHAIRRCSSGPRHCG